MNRNLQVHINVHNICNVDIKEEKNKYIFDITINTRIL